jgi:hypothetical protein
LCVKGRRRARRTAVLRSGTRAAILGLAVARAGELDGRVVLAGDDVRASAPPPTPRRAGGTVRRAGGRSFRQSTPARARRRPRRSCGACRVRRRGEGTRPRELNNNDRVDKPDRAEPLALRVAPGVPRARPHPLAAAAANPRKPSDRREGPRGSAPDRAAPHRPAAARRRPAPNPVPPASSKPRGLLRTSVLSHSIAVPSMPQPARGKRSAGRSTPTRSARRRQDRPRPVWRAGDARR